MPKLKMGKRSSVPGAQRLWISLIGDMQADQLDHFKINEITTLWEAEGYKGSTLNARMVALSRVYTWAIETHRYATHWNNPFKSTLVPDHSKGDHLTRERFKI